jgi:hypothetical protein
MPHASPYACYRPATLIQLSPIGDWADLLLGWFQLERKSDDTTSYPISPFSMQNPSPNSNPSPDSSSSSHFAFAHYNFSTSAVQPLTIHTPQHTQSRVDSHQRQYRNSNQSTLGLYTRGVDTLNCSSPNRASRRAYVLGRTVTEMALGVCLLYADSTKVRSIQIEILKLL